MLQMNNILRKYIKTTEFEIHKIPYLIHRLPKDSVSRRMVDDIDVIFLRKNIHMDTLSFFLFYLFCGGWVEGCQGVHCDVGLPW